MQVEPTRPGAGIGAARRLPGQDDDLAVRDDALDDGEMARLMARRADEERLDVVVRPAEADVRVGRLQAEVRRLRQLGG